MAKSVKGTQTEKNLLTSFAGEVYQHLSTKYRDFLEIARLLKVDIKNLLIESDANKQYSQFIEII